MYEHIIAHLSNISDLIVAGVVLLFLVSMFRSAIRQLAPLRGYLLASQKNRRKQNFIEIWRSVKNPEYIQLIEQRCQHARFFTIKYAITFAMIMFVTISYPQWTITFDLLGALALVAFCIMNLELFEQELLASRTEAARAYRAGMRYKNGVVLPRKLPTKSPLERAVPTNI